MTVDLPAYAQAALDRSRCNAAQRTAASLSRVIYTVQDVLEHEAPEAPNGDPFGTTTVIVRQDWSGDPVNGLCAGLSFRLTETWLSLTIGGADTHLVHTEVEPW